MSNFLNTRLEGSQLRIQSDCLRKSEQGMAMLVVLGLLLLLLVAATLVVDVGQGQRALHILDASVDAAALAGAVELSYSSNDSEDRWRNSKRAIFASFAANARGVRLQLPNPSVDANHVGDIDACESTGEYRSQRYQNNTVDITIERGIYDDSFPGTFISLEDSFTCNADSKPLPDAVRVQAEVTGFGGIFAPIIFGATLPPLRSSSIAKLND